MKKELYINTCTECHQTFRTDNPDKRMCPSCEAYSKPHQKKRTKKHKKKILTFAEILHIAEVYNKVNGKYLHYGDMVNIIDNTKAERCVCCGAIVPKGRQVCPQCERVAE